MKKLSTVLDNGPGKTGAHCDDCGAALRYEYHTDGGGIYGCECIHRHIHRPDWLTFKAARDAEIFAQVQKGAARQYEAILRCGYRTLRYTEYSDGGGTIMEITRYGERGASQVVERLLTEGWRQIKNGPPTCGGRQFHNQIWRLEAP